MKNTNTLTKSGFTNVYPFYPSFRNRILRNYKKILISAIIVCSSLQSYCADGDPFYGHTKRLYNITPWGHTRWGLEYLPDDFFTSSQKYPIIVYFHGTGETGSTEGSLANLLYNGPSNFIAFSNYNMQFVNPNTGQVQKCIYMALQAPYWSPDINEVWYVLKNNPRLKDRISNVFYTGLSAGGQQTMMSVLTNQEMASGITAIVPMSSAGFDRTGVQYARNAHVKAWNFHGLADNVCAWQITSDFNDSLGPLYSRWTQLPTIHANWNTLYTKDYRELINGYSMNIYEWMLSTIPATNLPPIADAGPDQTLNVPTFSTTLNGNGLDPDGLVSSYSWSKLSGPAQYTIANVANPVTSISDLTTGTYVFELIVTDDLGAIGKDTVVIVENSSPLPVTLVDFDVKKTSAGNQVIWSTSSEMNSDYFIIERSNNARIFESIGRVNAIGFSSVVKHYGFTDQSPVKGINYYRLLIVDKDSKTEYSRIVSATSSSGLAVEIVNSNLSFNKSSVSLVIQSHVAGTANLTIMNAAGRMILNSKLELQKGITNFERNINVLSKGVYYIKLFAGEERVLRTVACL